MTAANTSKTGPTTAKMSKFHKSMSKFTIMPTSEEAQRMPDIIEVVDTAVEDDDSLSKIIKKSFRSTRFDSTVSLRAAIWGCVRDLGASSEDSDLVRVLDAKGGMYDSGLTGCRSEPVSCISDVRFTGITLDNRSGLVFRMCANAPPGPARSHDPKVRTDFWRLGNSLRFGATVALVTCSYVDRVETDVRMATVAVDTRGIGSEQQNPTGIPSVHFSLSFPNTLDADWAIQQIQSQKAVTSTVRFLLVNPVNDYNHKPFLRGLQTSEIVSCETSLTQSLKSGKSAILSAHLPPSYSLRPGFEWELSHLLRTDADDWELSLAVNSPAAIIDVRRRLKAGSNLNRTHAQALVSALTSQVSLIEEGQGTGRSYLAIQLLRTFVLNKVGPVLVIAQNQQTLDHILTAVHASGDTHNILRLAGYSANSILEGMSIGASRAKVQLRDEYNGAIKEMYRYEGIMNTLSAKVLPSDASWQDHVEKCLVDNFGIHHVHLNAPSNYVKAMFENSNFEAASQGGQELSMWKFWMRGPDLKVLAKMGKEAKVEAVVIGAVGQGQGIHDKASDKAWAELFEQGAWDPSVFLDVQAFKEKNRFLHRFKLDVLPAISKTDRDLAHLLLDPKVWGYSTRERRRLGQYIEQQTGQQDHKDFGYRYKGLVQAHEASRLVSEGAQRKITTRALKPVQIVGCTVAGAAELQDIIKIVKPKVFLVVESGHILESHILAMLSPSMEHLVQIGNLRQSHSSTARPELSTESVQAAGHRSDRSMMERLIAAGYLSTRIETSWKRKAGDESEMAGRERQRSDHDDMARGDPTEKQEDTSSSRGDSSDDEKEDAEAVDTESIFIQQSIHDLANLAAAVPPLQFKLSLPEINALMATSLHDIIVLPAPGRLPNQLILDDILFLDEANLASAQPIPLDFVLESLETLFCFDAAVKEAWLNASKAILTQYEELTPLMSPPLHTGSILPFRIRATIQSILCRLILALLTRQFAAVLQHKGQRTPEKKRHANSAVHLANVLMWTLLRSCERDLRLAEHWAELAGTPIAFRVAILGCRTLVSQNIILTVLDRFPDRVEPERITHNDWLLARVEGETAKAVEDAMETLKAGGEGAPDEEQGRYVAHDLGRMQGVWRMIRACKRGSRAYEAAKGLDDGLQRMGGIFALWVLL